MRTQIAFLPLLLMGAVPSALPAAPKAAPDIQERVQAKLAGDPALVAALGTVAAEMKSIDWLVGTWEIKLSSIKDPKQVGTAEVTRVWDGRWLQLRDAYPGGAKATGFIGYNVAARQWQSLTIDNLGNANISRSAGWQGNRMIFEGDVVVLGLRAHLRQTVTKISDSEYHVANDELLSGKWRHVDDYHYTKINE